MRAIHSCAICGKLIGRELRWCPDCEYMTQPEAMRRLKISRPFYYRLVGQGKIHPRRLSERKVLVWRPEVEMLLEWRPRG